MYLHQAFTLIDVVLIQTLMRVKKVIGDLAGRRNFRRRRGEVQAQLGKCVYLPPAARHTPRNGS